MELTEPIYLNQCISCYKEGTYHCKLIKNEDQSCKNYDNHNKKIFGGY